MSAPVTRLTSVMESNGEVDGRVGFPDGFFVPSGHEAERFAFAEVHVRGMREDVKLVPGHLEGIELGKELLFGERRGRKAALGLVVGIHEVLHRISPFFVHRVFARLAARKPPTPGSRPWAPAGWSHRDGVRYTVVPGKAGRAGTWKVALASRERAGRYKSAKPVGRDGVPGW